MKKRQNRKRVAGNKNVKKVARQEAKKVLSQEVETKFYDGKLLANGADNLITAVGFNMYFTNDYSGGILAPTSMVQGPEQHAYLGQTIHPVSLQLRGCIDIDPSLAGDTHNAVTLLVWQAKGAFSASNTSATNQFEQVGQVTTPYHALNNAFEDRMRIIKRKVITVDPLNPTKSFTILLSKKHLRRIKFTNALGAIEMNPLVFTLISDSTVAGHPAVRCYWRLFYKDA